MRRYAAFGFAFGSLLAICAAVAGSAAEAPRFPSVTTLAGNGLAGNADGDRTAGEFLMPAGIAEDSHGTIYVADAAGQRIRTVDRNGNVATVAGGGPTSYDGLWSDGGYADGPASQARFYVPVAVAVDGSDRVFVADAHCVRMLAAGVVSTFAGSCSEAGDRQGPLRDARFAKPVGLAADRAGDVYVADELNGIREATAAGQVIALDFKVRRPSSISLWESHDGTTIAVADEDGFVLREPGGRLQRIPLRNTPQNPYLQADAPLGYPFGVVLTGASSAVYTDARTHTIRYLSGNATRVIAGSAFDDVENSGGGYRDGSGSEALFDSPMGITRDVDGGFVVADAGNRRLRHLSVFDQRGDVVPLDPGAPFPAIAKDTYNVLLVGNSFAWFDTDWQTSIGGLLQDRLNRTGSGRTARVITLPSMTLPATESYFHEFAQFQPIDLVILLVNSSTIAQAYAADTFPTRAWMAPMTRELSAIRAALPTARFVVALHPYPWEFSASESIYVRFYDYADGQWIYPSPSFHQELLTVSQRANLETLDLWPVFARAESAADHLPLFGTVSYHFTPAGRAVAAGAIAEYLEASPQRRR